VTQPEPRTRRSPVDWFFRNRQTGAITVAQPPNPPLWIFLATVLLRWLGPDDGTIGDVLAWIGLAALAWWALDEVFRGVNPWRRLLGAGGCALVVTGVAARLS
jgi:hypothetical protein